LNNSFSTNGLPNELITDIRITLWGIINLIRAARDLGIEQIDFSKLGSDEAEKVFAMAKSWKDSCYQFNF